jgi:hypothetical protein
MTKKPTLTNISSGFASNTQLNNNFQELRNAFDNTLSLDGSTPNAMLADLDLNGNNINNVGDLGITGELTLSGQVVTSLVTVPDWKGEWATGTAYVLNDLVKYNGTTYIVKIAHTSGTFSVDQGAGKLEVFAEKGSSGAGTGDMLTTNNLSDLTDKPQAIVNLGINATAAELNYVDGVTSAVQTQLDTKATLASPALTGTPTAPTATDGTNTTQLATTAFVESAFNTKIGVANSSLVKTALNATGSAPIYGARAWANFDARNLAFTGLSAPIRASGNIASIVDAGVNIWTVNFITPMPNANYVVIGGGTNTSGEQPIVVSTLINGPSGPYTSKTTTSFRIQTSDTDTDSNQDAWDCNIVVFG